jgi:hypothetical protein
MSPLGQSRRFKQGADTSANPPITSIRPAGRDRREGPRPTIRSEETGQRDWPACAQTPMVLIMLGELEPRRSTMSTKTIIAAAVVTVLISAAPDSAKALTGRIQATSRAYAAATKSLRTARPAQRSGVAQTSTQQVLGLDGRAAGADPDARIRFQLRRMVRDPAREAAALGAAREAGCNRAIGALRVIARHLCRLAQRPGLMRCHITCSSHLSLRSRFTLPSTQTSTTQPVLPAISAPKPYHEAISYRAGT